ncbi:MAG: SpoIIE family protein phosphatase [Acidobacteriota bacterium]
MMRPRSTGLLAVLAFGACALMVACLSILDMFLARAYDGVVLEPDRSDLTVRSVVSGSGADDAGIRPGDRISGLGQEIVRTPAEAARALQKHGVGERVAYLVERGDGLLEIEVELGPRRLGTPLYLYACFSGFLFFFIGLYVLLSRPDAQSGSPTHVFFILCTLFLLFLVCRLRPASYSWVDQVVLTTGMLSLLALPAAFLHFFMVFPRRVRLTLVPAEEHESGGPGALAAVERFVNGSPYFFTLLYLLPPVLYAATLGIGAALDTRVRLVSGAPLASWVLMGDYLVLGLLALLASLLRAREGRERRQIATVFVGTVLGVTPFLVLGVAFPSLFRNDRYLLIGVIPLVLVPLTFAYAIVRFQFFDIRVIVRRSLLYTLTTAVVSGTYAIGIAAFNLLFRDASLGKSPLFPLLLALAILALFDPLRRRLQEPVDRFFFREEYDARRAVEEVSEELVREFSVERLDGLLTTRLSEILHLEWATLYRREGKAFIRGASAIGLPQLLPATLVMLAEVARHERPVPIGDLEPLKALDRDTRAVLEALSAHGSRLLVGLRVRGELHALMVLGPKLSDEEYGKADLQLIKTVANQGAVALENARLYRERARQVELEKELEIARRVQFSLIPAQLPVPVGWQVAAICAPARRVGGDFYDALPALDHGTAAIVVGDVSGKSVPGAMLMVAAREVLQTAALGGASPSQIMQVANQRLYTPQPRLFVSLAFVVLGRDGTVEYALAGQPAPLIRRGTGRVEEGPAPVHRLPLGALRGGAWDFSSVRLEPGDVLIVYSDGLTEAQNEQGEFFGDERLMSVVQAVNGGPQSVVDQIVEEVGDFVGEAEPYDDVTVVALRWSGET